MLNNGFYVFFLGHVAGSFHQYLTILQQAFQSFNPIREIRNFPKTEMRRMRSTTRSPAALRNDRPFLTHQKGITNSPRSQYSNAPYLVSFVMLRRLIYEAERKNMKKCKECTHAGRDCIPYLMTVSQAETFAWCKIRKELLHMSNEEIADRTNVPKSTIDRIFSPKNTDCRFSTMQPVLCALSGCTAEELDCEAAFLTPSEALMEQVKAKDEIIRHLEEETKRQNEHIKTMEAAAQADIERAKKEEAESIAYMKKKEKGHVKAIYTLAVLLALTLLLIIAALIVDRLNPDIGFFWLRSLFDGTGSGVIERFIS